MSIIAEFLTTTPRTTTDRLRAGTATTPRASTSSTCPTVGCRRWPTPCPGTLGMSRMWSTPERLSTLLSLPVVTRADARYRQWWQDEDGRIHSSIIVLKTQIFNKLLKRFSPISGSRVTSGLVFLQYPMEAHSRVSHELMFHVPNLEGFQEKTPVLKVPQNFKQRLSIYNNHQHSSPHLTCIVSSWD